MKVGLFFGSFNPIHIGHLILAQYFLEFTDLQEVWLVVSPHNPFKKKSTLLNDHQRLHLVQLAVEDIPGLRASDVEFGLPQPSYTITTLIHLQEKYPIYEFSLLIGQDNLEGFQKWRNSNQLLDLARLLVYPREGAELPPWAAEHPRVHLEPAPKMEISSTFLRNALKKGKDVRSWLPAPVWEEIQKSGLYLR